MKKFISILAISCVIIAGFSPSIAKGKKELTTLQVDYTTLNADTVVELEEKTNYQIEFINLPENISSTQLRKRFSGKFMNIRSKREKTSELTSSHRVIVKQAKAGFEGKVRLRLFEETEDSDDDDNNGDDGNSDDGNTDTKLRDNVLVETIEFSLQIPAADDGGSNGDDNNTSPGSNVEVDYSTLTTDSEIEISKKTKTISFINLPEGAVTAQLKKDFKGRFINIRSKRETVTEASSSHRIRVKKAKPGFEGDVELYLYSASTDDSTSSKSREDDDSDDNDETDASLLASIEFEIFIAGGEDDNSDDDGNDDDDGSDDNNDDGGSNT